MSQCKYDLEQRLLQFAVDITHITEPLPASRVGNHVAHQLLRSGISPYPNHGEAQGAGSPKDFVHKLHIGFKELREFQRWLKLACRVPLIDPPDRTNALIAKSDELVRIFVPSIRTAGKRR